MQIMHVVSPPMVDSGTSAWRPVMLPTSASVSGAGGALARLVAAAVAQLGAARLTLLHASASLWLFRHPLKSSSPFGPGRPSHALGHCVGMSEITHEVFGRTISGRLSAALLPAEGPDQVTVRVVGRASAAYIVKAQNRTATNEMKPGLSDASYYTSSSSARADGVEFFSVELPFVDAGGRFEGSVPTGLPPALSVDASGHSQRLGPGNR